MKAIVRVTKYEPIKIDDYEFETFLQAVEFFNRHPLRQNEKAELMDLYETRDGEPIEGLQRNIR